MLKILLSPINYFFSPRSRIWYLFYRQIDAAFRVFDDRRIQITEHLRLIPPARYRTGGQSAITEYANSIGIMSAYFGEHVKTPNPAVLDLGCGTGKMVSAVFPFLGSSGHYTGLDISRRAIKFAQSWYPAEQCSFIHADLYNARYNPDGKPVETYKLPIESNSLDAAVAFSLFTHLNEPDTRFYFQELNRVLKPNGIALFTFFLLDDRYRLEEHIDSRWYFDCTIEGQPDWRWSSAYKIPERQIAVTPAGIEKIIGSNFEWLTTYNGWWTGQPGAFLQDTLVFRRR